MMKSPKSRFEQALQLIAAKKKGKHLDVGSSDGAFIQNTKRLGYSSVALEPYPKKDSIEKNIVKGFCENMGFTSNAFDLITLLDVFEHVQDESKSVSEIRRVLKKGGTLIISVPHSCWYDCLDPGNLIPAFIRFISKDIFLKKYPLFQKHRHYSESDLDLFFHPQHFNKVTVRKNGTLFGLFLIYFELIFPTLQKNPVVRWFKGKDYACSLGNHSYHIMIAYNKL